MAGVFWFFHNRHNLRDAHPMWPQRQGAGNPHGPVAGDQVRASETRPRRADANASDEGRVAAAEG